ncbi:hypothetical protein Taro_040145 [Colocasia esculenta]|uniref:Uncharacterized protein n=1 Tax=Colocasia esculenta TaxID=4460 RepID=A0A843WHU7_COLES|nr:hypothetical protein [Colocasia esculenta]
MSVPKKGTHAVLARPCRVLLGEYLVVSFPAGSECVAAAAGGACCEHGWYFVRAAVGFVLGLCVRVGVSRRLREPTCGVAFTGAGLWSAEPLCVWPCVPVRRWALCSPQSASLLKLSRCFFANVSGCLALPTSGIFSGLASMRVPVERVV